ncbi:multiprotein-bridging factor 1 family protein [Telmatospirillum sp.]|uniref:helix-turn-helix domain-containing protein n=1 Tax=Telmatospirillum sp. TaxID=2079197 RepID=UPI0038645B42
MLIDQLIGRIRAYRISQGWSVSKLAKEASLNESTIRNLDSASWCPTVETLRKLERVIPQSFEFCTPREKAA